MRLGSSVLRYTCLPWKDCVQCRWVRVLDFGRADELVSACRGILSAAQRCRAMLYVSCTFQFSHGLRHCWHHGRFSRLTGLVRGEQASSFTTGRFWIWNFVLSLLWLASCKWWRKTEYPVKNTAQTQATGYFSSRYHRMQLFAVVFSVILILNRDSQFFYGRETRSTRVKPPPDHKSLWTCSRASIRIRTGQLWWTKVCLTRVWQQLFPFFWDKTVEFAIQTLQTSLEHYYVYV